METGICWKPACGLDWVLDDQSHEQIDLVNLSLGSTSLPGKGLFKEAIQKTIQNKIPIVVSAGNDRSSVQNYSPAQYEGVITVSALGSGKRQFGNFSNYGNTGNSSVHERNLIRRYGPIPGRYSNIVNIVNNLICYRSEHGVPSPIKTICR